MSRAKSSACLLAAAALTAGCQTIDNDRLTLGPGVPGHDASLASFNPPPPLTPASGPAGDNLNRANWQVVELSSPYDRVESNPAFTSSTWRDNRRHDGAFPTTDDALDITPDYNGFGIAPRQWQRAPVSTVPAGGIPAAAPGAAPQAPAQTPAK